MLWDKPIRSCVNQFPITPFWDVPNSEKLQMTTEMWLFKDYTDSKENIVEKGEIAYLSNFTFFHNVFLKLFCSMC